MKFLILIFALAFNVTANAKVTAQSACGLAAGKVVKQMYLGTIPSDRRLAVVVAQGFDENSDNVHDVSVVERVAGNSVAIAKYKAVAKGSDESCEILSVTKISN